MTSKWSEDTLAIQKLANLGASTLSDAELLGIIIGKGTTEQSATEIAKELLRNHHNNITEISQFSPACLKKFNGMDGMKANHVTAALELGRRMKIVEHGEVESISKLNEIVRIFQPMLGHLKHEEVWVLYMTSSNRIIEKTRISHGGVGGAVVDTKIVLKRAIELLASSIILVHNHPSSNAQPSEADIRQTKKIVEASRFLDLRVLDHVIISGNEYFSFLSHKLLDNI